MRRDMNLVFVFCLAALFAVGCAPSADEASQIVPGTSATLSDPHVTDIALDWPVPDPSEDPCNWTAKAAGNGLVDVTIRGETIQLKALEIGGTLRTAKLDAVGGEVLIGEDDLPRLERLSDSMLAVLTDVGVMIEVQE